MNTHLPPAPIPMVDADQAQQEAILRSANFVQSLMEARSTHGHQICRESVWEKACWEAYPAITAILLEFLQQDHEADWETKLCAWSSSSQIWFTSNTSFTAWFEQPDERVQCQFDQLENKMRQVVVDLNKFDTEETFEVKKIGLTIGHRPVLQAHQGYFPMFEGSNLSKKEEEQVAKLKQNLDEINKNMSDKIYLDCVGVQDLVPLMVGMAKHVCAKAQEVLSAGKMVVISAQENEEPSQTQPGADQEWGARPLDKSMLRADPVTSVVLPEHKP